MAADPEATLPRTPRNYLRRAWAWCVEHPHYAVPVAAFAAGFALGAVLI